MTFGIIVNEPVDGLRPVLEKSLSIVGVVCTASAAAGQATADLDAAFPVDTPVLVTDLDAAIEVAGSGGTLAPVLQTIREQGKPLVIVSRAVIDADPAVQEDLTIAAAQALMYAEAHTGIRPRILGAPGLDSPDVVASFVSVAQALRGFLYFHLREADGTLCADRDDAVTAAGNFGQRELMGIWPDFTGAVAFDGKAVAVALGLRAMIDQRSGWHDSIANVAVNGVTGITVDVSFDIRDDATDAGVLNTANVTTLVRMNGFRFWGVRTLAGLDQAAFSFEVATRSAQAIQDAIADAEAPYLKRPMTVGLAKNIVETANMKLANWVAQGRLMGGSAWLNDALNPVINLQNGQLAVDYDYGFVAPLEGLTLNQRITGRYYLGFADQVNG